MDRSSQHCWEPSHGPMSSLAATDFFCLYTFAFSRIPCLWNLLGCGFFRCTLNLPLLLIMARSSFLCCSEYIHCSTHTVFETLLWGTHNWGVREGKMSPCFQYDGHRLFSAKFPGLGECGPVCMPLSLIWDAPYPRHGVKHPNILKQWEWQRTSFLRVKPNPWVPLGQDTG